MGSGGGFALRQHGHGHGTPPAKLTVVPVLFDEQLAALRDQPFELIRLVDRRSWSTAAVRSRSLSTTNWRMQLMPRPDTAGSWVVGHVLLPADSSARPDCAFDTLYVGVPTRRLC